MAEFPVRAGDLAALGALFAPGIARDPYPVYRQWRAERPIARPRERLFVLSRFADCEAVLADAAFGRAEEDGPRPMRSLLRLNPPDHTRLRRLVSRAFTPSRSCSPGPMGGLT
jgi:cytochrome P450